MAKQVMSESEQTPTRQLLAADSFEANNRASLDHHHHHRHPSHEPPPAPATATMELKTYKYRYFLVAIFIALSLSNAFQWIEYAIIETIIVEYYHTTTFWVNCTSVVFMASYIVGIIPATWMLNRFGLRNCLILGAVGNALGSWIKCFSVRPTLFWMTMTGQTVVAFSQLFILNIPPVLAATWFPAHQVSTATAYGVFGNQIGIALGFLLPSMIVPPVGNHTVDDTVLLGFIRSTEQGLRVLSFSVATVATVIMAMILIFFKDAPKFPPSHAAAKAKHANTNLSFSDSLRSLFTNFNFVIIFISYGLNVGVFYGLSTTLTQMITKTLGEKHLKDSGQMGLAITLAGIVGSVVCGSILGYSKRFKLVTLFVYLFSLLSTVGWTIGIEYESIYYLYAIAIVLGFFMTGYLPIGFEFAAEVSYPNPEGISAGLLNASAQVSCYTHTFPKE